MASKRVIVIGAGAAGIIAAWRAASLGAKVTLLEKTPRLGTKILISGGGKCNITHEGTIEDVLRAFRPNEARFLRSSIYRFPNTKVIELLTSRGLEVYTRPDGRIFPVRQTAKQVVDILHEMLTGVGVKIHFESPVIGIEQSQNRVLSVGCHGCKFHADEFIFSTGGSSYPNSGTTGDGWAWARALGLKIVPIRAALAPLYLNPISHESRSLDIEVADSKEGRFVAAAGTSLHGIGLQARADRKIFARWIGDLLFTHHGVSGPCALGISREVAERLPQNQVTIEVDFFPGLSPEQANQNLRDWIRNHGSLPLIRYLEPLLPGALLTWFCDDAGLDRKLAATSAPKALRNRVATLLKGWPIGSVRTVPLEKGECVAGGIDLAQIDPRTMRSSVCENAYFCGEILDISGPVGGYNLQAAFSTGFVAGEESALSNG